MSRAVACSALAAIALAAALLGVGFAAGSAAASPQPGPFCGVCGEAFDENVTATQATLQMTADGDVRWRVENEVRPRAAEAWREDPEVAERRAREALDYGFVRPSNPTDLSVRVREDTVVVEFVDRGAVRERLGLLVLPYFHGEGSPHRWTVNADELVVEAPEGHRIVNEPTGGTVEEDQVVWTGSIEHYSGREPGDAYVVAGKGETADVRAAAATAVMPLDPALYGLYGVGLLLVAGVTFGVYTVQGTRLGPRRVLAAIGIVSLPYVFLVAGGHPPSLGGLGGAFLFTFGVLGTVLLGVIGGTVLYQLAAAADDADTEVTR